MKQLPRLWQRQRDRKAFGAWHIYIRNKPINLRTDDIEIARERRKEAVRGKREWPRKMSRVAAQETLRDQPEGAVANALAALGEIAPDVPMDTPAAPAAAAAAPSGFVPPAPEVIEPEPIPEAPADAGNWAADLGGAGAAPIGDVPGDALPPRLRLADFEWFAALLVTGSKVCVGLQLAGQAWAMKLVGDVQAGRVGPPPVLREPDGPASMAAFMTAAAMPWDATDPRERGRRAYEKTIVALIPDELPVPAWLKWFEAPMVTALDTVPIQLATATKIERDAEGNEIRHDAQPTTETPPVQATEAAPDARAAA